MKFFVAVTTCLTACIILNNGSALAFLAPTRTLIVPSPISSSCAVPPFDPVSSRRPEHVVSIRLPSSRRGTAAEAALAVPEVALGLQDELRRLCATKSEPGREARIEEVAKELNALNPTKDPARSPLLAGRWRMLYSTVPGPSSGRLGPFVGDVFQDIRPDEKRIINILELGPSWALRVRECVRVILARDEGYASQPLLLSGLDGWGKRTSRPRAIAVCLCLHRSTRTNSAGTASRIQGALEADVEVLDGNNWAISFDVVYNNFAGVKVQKKFDPAVTERRIWSMTYLDDGFRILYGRQEAKSAEEGFIFVMERDRP
ncbi:unnamed protein product [Ectocarpus sp. 4 AP-2014]